jgi:hypothetical protein
MIVTSSKPYGIIRGLLEEGDKIGVVSCNSCVRACETGGREPMDHMADRLRNDGFAVVDEDLIPMCCDLDLVRKPNYDGDILIVLACDAGVDTLKKLFPKKTVVAALDTMGLGARDGKGTIYLIKRF